MTREIKFRAWDKDTSKVYSWINMMHWAFGTAEWDQYDFQQFTGLHDKNGKEIYEGDVFGSMFQLRCVVKRQKDGAYQLSFLDKRIKPISILDRKVKDSLILGNIYENPELLKS